MRTRIAKWPDGQPFNVFDLFEEANTPNNIELNKKRGAWSADSIPDGWSQPNRNLLRVSLVDRLRQK